MKKQVTPEEILAVMEEGVTYYAADLAALVGTEVRMTVTAIRALSNEGKIERGAYRGRSHFTRKEPLEVVGPRYLAPMKPLTGYDPFALMRRCEASRNPVTGAA